MKTYQIILLGIALILFLIFIPYGFNIISSFKIESKFYEIDCNKIIKDNSNSTIICDDFSFMYKDIFISIILKLLLVLILVFLSIYIKYSNKSKNNLE